MYLSHEKANELLDSRGADMFVSIDPRLFAAAVIIGAIVACAMLLFTRGRSPKPGETER